MKENFERLLLFVKIKMIENKLRTGAFFCLLLVGFSFFLPFMSAQAGVSVSGFGDTSLDVISPEYDLINLSLGDFVLQKPIDDLTVYGVPLGKVKVLDQSILQLLRKPIPESGLIANVNVALANPAFDFIIDPRLTQAIDINLNNGQTINSLLKDAYTILQGTRRIAGTVNTVSLQARQAMDEVNATMAVIDGYKSQANGLIFTLFFLVIVLMALTLYKRAHIGLSIFFSGLLSFLFIGIGGAVAMINSQINAQLVQFTSRINDQILEALRSILTGTLGDLGAFIANFIGGRANFLFMSFFIQLKTGYWLITLGLVGSFVLLILDARHNQKIKNQALLPIEKEITIN